MSCCGLPSVVPGTTFGHTEDLLDFFLGVDVRMGQDPCGHVVLTIEELECVPRSILCRKVVFNRIADDSPGDLRPDVRKTMLRRYGGAVPDIVQGTKA